jgi:hypothetical protein
MSDIIILTPGDSMRAEYVVSLTNTLNYLLPQGVIIKFGNGQSSLIAKARQTLYEAARQMEFSRMVWIDSDMSWQVDDFLKLVATDHDILTGCYLDELGRVVATGLDGNRVIREQLDEQESFEIESCGFGFISLSKDVVDCLVEPFILDGQYGEDIAFCYNARNMGFKIFIDPIIKVVHHKMTAITL